MGCWRFRIPCATSGPSTISEQIREMVFTHGTGTLVPITYFRSNKWHQQACAGHRSALSESAHWLQGPRPRLCAKVACQTIAKGKVNSDSSLFPRALRRTIRKIRFNGSPGALERMWTWALTCLKVVATKIVVSPTPKANNSPGLKAQRRVR